jgi:hypothetical protein
MVHTGKSKNFRHSLLGPKDNGYIFTYIRYQQFINGSCSFSVILVCGRPDRSSEYLKVSILQILYLMPECVDSVPMYIFQSYHRIVHKVELFYEGNSISKLQIQVATYVFELSAGNCHC